MLLEPYTATYSRTLLEAAQDRATEDDGVLEAVRDDVELLLALFESAPRLQLLLESPRVQESEKLGVVKAALEGRCVDILYRFVRLVVDKGRAEGLREILAQFLVDHDRAIGRVRVNVTTAVPLGEAQTAGLQGTLEKKLDKTVVLENQVDEEILGGMVVRFEGMVADASLKKSLDRFGADMMSLRLGSELVHED